jgi:hypothetical protein
MRIATNASRRNVLTEQTCWDCSPLSINPLKRTNEKIDSSRDQGFVRWQIRPSSARQATHA